MFRSIQILLRTPVTGRTTTNVIQNKKIKIKEKCNCFHNTMWFLGNAVFNLTQSWSPYNQLHLNTINSRLDVLSSCDLQDIQCNVIK